MSTVFRWAIAHDFMEANLAGEAIDGALPPMPNVKAHLRSLPYQEVGAALETVEASLAFADDLADAQQRLDTAAQSRFQQEWADNKARVDADPDASLAPWWDEDGSGPLSDAVRQARARDEALGRDGAAGVAELHGRLIAESALLGLGAGAAVKVGAKAAQFGRSADAGYRALMQRLVDASGSGPRSGQPYGGPVRGASGTAQQQLHPDVVKLLDDLGNAQSQVDFGRILADTHRTLAVRQQPARFIASDLQAASAGAERTAQQIARYHVGRTIARVPMGKAQPATATVPTRGLGSGPMGAPLRSWQIQPAVAPSVVAAPAPELEPPQQPQPARVPRTATEPRPATAVRTVPETGLPVVPQVHRPVTTTRTVTPVAPARQGGAVVSPTPAPFVPGEPQPSKPSPSIQPSRTTRPDLEPAPTGTPADPAPRPYTPTALQGQPLPDSAVQLFTPTQPEPEPHTPTEPEADLFTPPAEAQRPPGYPLKPRARNIPGYRKVTPAPLPDPDGGPEERPDDDAAALAGQYPRAITHDETVTYSYDPDTDTFRAVVDADRPRVTRTDDSPPDGGARPVGGWHIRPTAHGVEAAARDVNPQVPDDIADELRARAEAEGGLVSTTTRREFEHDLDTGVTERRRVDTKELAARVLRPPAAGRPASAEARRLAALIAAQAETKPKPRRKHARRKDDDLLSMNRKNPPVVVIRRGA